MVSVSRLLAALLVTGALALLPLGAASASSTTSKRIAYVTATGITTIGADGTGTANLGQAPLSVSSSSDGQTIFYDETANGILSIPFSGGTPTPRCAGHDPAISPDGQSIAYVTGNGAVPGTVTIGALACDTGTKTFATGSSPAWSPDGSQIVFIDGASDIVIAPASGGAAEKLTTTADAESDPAFSPDGAKIAYISGAELFMMNADGTNRVQLTSNGAAIVESSPSWAPGGDEIVYVSGTNLYAITPTAPTGQATRQLTEATGASRPDWGLAVANKVKPTITKPDSSGWSDGTQLTAGQGEWSSISGLTSFAYQWKRCGSAGTGCVDISGATSAIYTLTPSDVGSTVRVVVTATTPDGSASGTSVAKPDAPAVITASGPQNVTPPTISGTPIVAGTLTASPGTWTGSNPVFTYQWQKCDSAGNCPAIDGATANVYVPTQSDVGSTLRVNVRATNSVNFAEKTSEATAPVASRVPANTSPPVISETVSSFDNTVSYAVSQGTWTGAATLTFRYQWRRCNATTTTTCADISGATTTSYTPVNADIGSRLRVVVTVTNSFGSATATSEPSSVVAGLSPANSFPPSITGDSETGAVLTSSNGTWSGSAPITYTYEWRRCNSSGASCAAIPGATAQSYIVQTADAGGRIVLAVTAKNVVGTATAVSPPTAVITVSTTPPPSTSTRPTNTQAPSFRGTLVQGQRLTASNGSWSGTTPMTFSYQWQRCSATATSCTAIALATGSTYTLVAADVGRRIRLAVTASNAAGSTQELSLVSRVVGKKGSAPKPAAGRKINGTPRADNLKGTAGPDTIRAGAGNDRINPGAGRDTVFGGAGNDTVQAADKTRDVIDCGAGRDTVVADKIDVLKGCENVKRR
jgi:hypothetical protein